ncbi:MAG: adenylate/guanylate cyclase domain-containing protein [Myxococcales bacterium]|nr:MAG: adenylate/guanylate cyclase domain-containing protein [Myxococcales bacterium]
MSDRPLEPETRYAKSSGLHIAYMTVGDGPIDLVMVPGFTSHLECLWEQPRAAALWHRLAAFARLIIIDKRGTGLSDRVPEDQLPTLEQRMDDLRAVMDAAGSERAALLGFWEGGPMCTLFAATYPERTRALILFAAPAAFRQSEDYPWALTDEEHEDVVRSMSENWGQGLVYAGLAPSVAGDEAMMRWFGRIERMGASPGAVIALWRMNKEIDIRHVLPSVHVPTLLLHRREDPAVPLDVSRYIARRIEGARLVELDGKDHLPWVGDTESLAAEIRSFLTGTREEVYIDRILATILFVDIVGSTEQAVELGDSRWRRLLDEFYTMSAGVLEQHRGRRVNTTGDGFLASFDGPARAIRCAQALVEQCRPLGLHVRAGLHTGECELRGEDLGGIAVHIGSRVADLAPSDGVLVSGTVKDLVAGSGIAFDARGQAELKGLDGTWKIYQVREDRG